MRNLLKFIEKHGNFLVFILLEVVAFLIVIANNAYPRSSFFSSANSFVAWQYEVTDNISNYFELREINRQLAAENTRLKNRLMAVENAQEPAREKHKEYIYSHLEYNYIPAKVIQFTIGKNHNYMTINKGLRDGVKKDMGVVNQDGVVGIVVTVSQKFAVVMPIINNGLNVSCRIKKNQQLGSLVWNNSDTQHAGLTQIESHIEVNEGDTLVTSGLTPAFPADIVVGTVEKDGHVFNNGQVVYNIRLQTNFNKLNYVQVIQNNAVEELNQLQNELE